VASSTLSSKLQQRIIGLLLAALAFLTLVSVATWQVPLLGQSIWSTANACGPVGAGLATVLVRVFGRFASYGVPLLCAIWGWNRLRARPAGPLIVSSLVGLLLVFEVCTLLGLGGLDRAAWAGAWGFAGAFVLHSALGSVGSWIVAGTLFTVTALAASELGFHWIAHLARRAVVDPAKGIGSALGQWRQERDKAGKARPRVVAPKPAPRVVAPPAAGSAESPPPKPRISSGGPISPLEQLDLPAPVGARAERARQREKEKETAQSRPVAAAGGNGNGTAPEVPTEALPALSLLSMSSQPEDLLTAEDLTGEANLLVTKLKDFDIEGKVTEIHPGPVVTTFEFEPAAGVKVSQIVSREDDLAMALRAQRIRILAPIPGKAAVGVEIPNRRRRMVYLREVLSSAEYESSHAALKMPLGVDVVGQPYVADLTKMPHLLVAGATGSGKSVCLNAIITGLLFQLEPSELQIVMIDPKMLELSAYNGIPHLVFPVITQAKQASRALRSVVAEMEKRYKLMAKSGARHISGYNEKVAAGLVPGEYDERKMREVPAPKLPYLVVVVDELADLMLTAPGEIEEPVARLAQMARAVGIHLILATQRPSVDVITGVIKANFPSRMAFQVASKTDSRTVLDMNGAENLLGNGDMLFMPAGRPEPYRIHGAYVSEDETARVVEFWRAKAAGAATHAATLATDMTLNAESEETEGEGGDDDDDELILEAARLVVHHQQGSTSLLQRRLKVGYSRAGRLMDQLEQRGVVGPFQGSKAREVLVDERWVEDNLA
jgi:DNA segregation ATPase FtsK/SpoIIIE, S-DNA-T family